MILFHTDLSQELITRATDKKAGHKKSRQSRLGNQSKNENLTGC